MLRGFMWVCWSLACIAAVLGACLGWSPAALPPAPGCWDDDELE